MADTMKRKFPLFIIDTETYEAPQTHYISCTDEETPFVISVKVVQELPAKHTSIYELKGSLLFEVVKVAKDANEERVKTLLKKAIKKYLAPFSHRNYTSKDLSIDNQIYQQELTISRAKRKYDELLAQADGNKELADFAIRLAEATLESLKAYKAILAQKS